MGHTSSTCSPGTSVDNPVGVQRWGGAKHMAKHAKKPAKESSSSMPCHRGRSKGTLLLLPVSGAAQAARHYTEKRVHGAAVGSIPDVLAP